jgi:hypothetical protein
MQSMRDIRFLGASNLWGKLRPIFPALQSMSELLRQMYTCPTDTSPRVFFLMHAYQGVCDCVHARRIHRFVRVCVMLLFVLRGLKMRACIRSFKPCAVTHSRLDLLVDRDVHGIFEALSVLCVHAIGT